MRRALAAALAALVVAAMAGSAGAAEEQPYRVGEFAVATGVGFQHGPLISGDRVFWRGSDPSGARTVVGRDLATGRDLSVTAENPGWPTDLDGDNLLFAEDTEAGQVTLVVYRVTDGARRVVALPLADASGRASARISGNRVAWCEGAGPTDVFVYDLQTEKTVQVASVSARRDSPAISGNLVVWLDRRNANPLSVDADIYGYDLEGEREFRITSQPEAIGPPAISGSVVVWAVQRDDGPHVVGYDLLRATSLSFAALPAGSPAITGVDVSGDLVVWSAQPGGDDDVFGYDLRFQRSFVVSRAVGNQSDPRISGRTVVWTDTRNAGLGKYQRESDIYGARLEPGPSAAPPAIGAPETADASIEIIWPHGGASVSQATSANVAAWLFLPGSLDLAPCQWNPRVELYRAVNSDPARLVALGRKTVGHYQTPSGEPIPTWEFNDVDVSAARNLDNRLFFFVRVDGPDGEPGLTSVWSHGSDARTFFPKPDVPAGLAPAPTGQAGVEAKIEIVWPHDGAAVDQARLVNVSAMVFAPGTLLSVPPDFAPRVRLYRSLNNGFLEPVAWGEKRTVAAQGFSYPVWDFNDVDVSAAIDPTNKYYFTLGVEGVPTATNVWAHGADARTYFPQMDAPSSPCR